MSNQNNTGQNEIQLFTTRDVSRILKCGLSSVSKISEEMLPRIHFGRLVRYRRESIQKFIEKCEYKKEKKNESSE